MSDTVSTNTGTAEKAPGGLTQRDLEILSKAWGAMKTQPEIDYVKLAEACGMTNPRSASNAWSIIKKKLFINAPATGSAPKAAETPKKRKAPVKKTPAKTNTEVTVKDEPVDGDDIEAEASPAKKTKATPRAKATKATKAKTPSIAKDSDDTGDEKNDSGDEKEVPTKKASRNLKANTKAKRAGKAPAAESSGAAAETKVVEAKVEEDSDGPEGGDTVPTAETPDGEV